MKKVLIIGSGNRVRGAIIPALFCLKDQYEIVSVYSRKIKTFSLFNGAYSVTTINTLNKINFIEINLIVIAVTLGEVSKVLKLLSAYDTNHIVLMLDTPVLPLKGIFSTRFFRRYKNVLTSEDCIALPPLSLAKKIIDEGKIGKVRNIYFFHNGYKYHAIASLQMLADDLTLPYIINRKFPEGIVMKEFFFKSKIRALLYEPRDYDNCRFLIEGDSGSIADYPHKSENVFHIGYQREGSFYTGLTLQGVKIESSQLDKAYLSLKGICIHESSFMNTMKIRALMDIITGSDNYVANTHYHPSKSIVSNLALILSEKIGIA